MTTDANQGITFMAFWKALNTAMEDRGVEPVRYGDVRHLWDVALDELRQDHERELQRRLKVLAA